MAPKQRNVVGSSSATRIPMNPLVYKYCQRNTRKKVTYSTRAEGNVKLKFSNLSKEEKNAFRERLSKLQTRNISVQRLIDWDLFNEYECEEQLRGMMKMTYVYPDDGDMFEDLFGIELLVFMRMFIGSGVWSFSRLCTLRER